MWTTVVLLLILCGLVVAKFKSRYQYWKKKKVPYIEPSIPFGNLEPPYARSKSFGEFLQDMHNHFRSRGAKHGGFFNFLTPVYMPVHPEYFKSILVDGFSHFVNRGIYYDEKRDPILVHVLGLEGAKWRGFRSVILPAFNTNNLKLMMPILSQCCEILKNAIDSYAESGESLEAKDLMTRFTTDVIGSCGFGLSCNAVAEKHSAFRRLSNSLFQLSMMRNLKFTISSNFPLLGQLIGQRLVPEEDVEFVMGVVRDTVEARRREGADRYDLLQILMQMRRVEMVEPHQRAGMDPEETLNVLDIASGCLGLFTAGFETSSTMLAYALLEISVHQEVQQAMRQEVAEVLERHGGEVTYEALADMRYVSQVIDETMRVHPPVAYLKRMCNKDYQVPGTDVVINRGTNVLLSVVGMHMNEEYYPDPEKFDPSRFTEENKRRRPPCTYLPFSQGPRTCMGPRFALLEGKLALVTLLRQYKFTLDPRTKVPVPIDIYSFFFTAPAEGLWIRVERICNKI